MIGITIITGFLGSGKTTLLKNLLNESLKKNKKIAIIHNEFTENNNNIDKIVFKDINDIYNFPKENGENINAFNNENINSLKIINEIESEEGFIYELNNGCLCCSNKSNFVKLIENILSLKTSYDYIFVEVSGVYDNIKINNLLWLDELNKSKIYLDSIIHIIDSYNFLNSFNDNIQYYESLKKSNNISNRENFNNNIFENKDNIVCEQIIVCDVIIINKIDKISMLDKEKIKTFINNINPLSSIYLTSYSVIPIEDITNLRCYEKRNIKNVLNTVGNKKYFHYIDFNNCSFEYEHNILYLIHLSDQLNKMKKNFLKEKNKNILKDIFSLKKNNIFSYKKINDILASLLWGNDLHIYRGKGIFVAFNDDIYNNKNKLKLSIYYYQSVGDLFEINLVISDLHVFFRNYLKTSQEGERKYENNYLNHSPFVDNNLTSLSNNNDNINNDNNMLFIYKDFFDDENYFSDDSTTSDNGEYNLNNILNSYDIFTSKFLFIGKNINTEEVKNRLNECLYN
ncbi:COBW domain-containing protein 1, putative [Plasmodium gallinaceum]|uniref:COBW domain-containing protein 1, putative n=1 Tax=Plasmodium gallinaceum TaxID=5849 RepID=A0A1J1GX26_PLAGA|nr:COBW domain-containing protein 1, putative [Plasmodium gallinaceum]CRG95576.1 COBW domain-containing protein 1, putative [Plasmodium gallinaceum]